MMEDEEQDEPVIEVLRGRYEVLRVLGEGALGRTYLARDRVAFEQVALKELLPSRMKRWKDFDLFHRECSTLKGLSHPGIPRYIEDFVEEPEGGVSRLFLVQEFVAGQNLQDMLDEGRTFEEDEVRDIMTQTLEILSYLHTSDPPVIHRDIKPANLMYTPQGKIKLIDFGAVRESITADGIGSTVVGTFGYMPPEQYAGASSAGTDLFALGATCVQLLSGRAPGELFEGLHTFRLPDGLAVTLGLEFILLRMTEADVTRRYASAREVLVELRSRFLMVSRAVLRDALPIPRELRPAPRPWPGMHLRDAKLGYSHTGIIAFASAGAGLSVLFPIVVVFTGQAVWAVLGVFLALCTCAMASSVTRLARAEVEIYRQGQYTLGEVTGRFLSTTNSAGVHLTYRYKVGGGFEHGAIATADSAYQDLSVGDPLGVIYSPGAPRKHILYAVPAAWAKLQALPGRARAKQLT
jgi:hypothetical protein